MITLVEFVNAVAPTVGGPCECCTELADHICSSGQTSCLDHCDCEAWDAEQTERGELWW